MLLLMMKEEEEEEEEKRIEVQTREVKYQLASWLKGANGESSSDAPSSQLQ